MIEVDKNGRHVLISLRSFVPVFEGKRIGPPHVMVRIQSELDRDSGRREKVKSMIQKGKHKTGF
jgi:hypothetical protein